MKTTLKTIAAGAILTGAAFSFAGTAGALDSDPNRVETFCSAGGGRYFPPEFIDPAWSDGAWWVIGCLVDDGYLQCTTLPAGADPRTVSGYFPLGDWECDYVHFGDDDDPVDDGELIEDEPSQRLVVETLTPSTGTISEPDPVPTGPTHAEPGPSTGTIGQPSEPSGPTGIDMAQPDPGSWEQAPSDPIGNADAPAGRTVDSSTVVRRSMRLVASPTVDG